MIQSFQGVCPSGFTVAEFEKLLRAAIFKPVAELFGKALQQAADRHDAHYRPRPGERYKGRAALEVQCIFGPFTLERDYYHHAGKRHGHCPADAALGLEGSLTPALAGFVCLEGSDESSFGKAELHLREVGGIPMDARRIQRVVQKVGKDATKWLERDYRSAEPCDAAVMYVSADATGIPMRKEELAGRKGKQPDGTSKTRMAMLGCVFTQHGLDDDGMPVRDHASTTYLGALQGTTLFGAALRREAARRGSATARRIVMLIDGAPTLEKLGHDYFPSAVQIVDFYHAMEHLTQLIEALLGKGDSRRTARRRHHWRKMLLADGLERIINQARQEAVKLDKEQQIEALLGYFVHNVPRMQYGTFRREGLFIGSGVIEAGCRTVIGARCKHSGMFWSQSGLNNIIALRCINASNYSAEFWKDRLAAKAASNHTKFFNPAA